MHQGNSSLLLIGAGFIVFGLALLCLVLMRNPQRYKNLFYCRLGFARWSQASDS